MQGLIQITLQCAFTITVGFAFSRVYVKTFLFVIRSEIDQSYFSFIVWSSSNLAYTIKQILEVHMNKYTNIACTVYHILLQF